MTDQQIIQKLTKLRDDLAKRSGRESYKILQWRTIQEIASIRPTTLEELKKVKGIGDKKLQQFGKMILEIVACGDASVGTAHCAVRNKGAVHNDHAVRTTDPKIFTVSSSFMV